MSRTQFNGEGGFAVAWVVAILMVVGVIIAAVLQLAPISLRAAVREQHSVQALAHAESGIAYALTWLQYEGFDTGGPGLPSTERQLGDGGFRNVIVTSRGDDEFGVAVTGYVLLPQGGEVARRVETAIKLSITSLGSVFYTHVGRMSDPGNDHIPVDIEWESPPKWNGWDGWKDREPWQPTPQWSYCDNYDTSLRNIGAGELCRWGTPYDLTWEGRDSAIVSSIVRMENGMTLGFGRTLTASNSTIMVDGSLNIAQSTTTWDNVNFYVDGTTTLGDGGSATFKGPTTIQTTGDFEVKGSKTVTFNDPTTVYVGGSGELGKGSTTTFRKHTTIHTGEDLHVGGSGSVEFLDGATFRVGGNLILDGSGSLKMHGGATIYVDGDLTLEGSGTMDFGDGATFYVNGNVTINGGAWAKGASGKEPPWIIMHVRKGLEINGSAGAGANVPDFAFLFSTALADSHHPIKMTGSSGLRGGIYAPTRDVSLTWSSQLWGSVIGQTVSLANPNSEDIFKGRYEAREERMQSFHLQAESRRTGSERLLEWREVR